MSHVSASTLAAGQLERAGVRHGMQSTVWHAVADAPSRLVAWIVERRRVHRMIGTLEALSDHTLKDIGIERWEIADMARRRRRA